MDPKIHQSTDSSTPESHLNMNKQRNDGVAMLLSSEHGNAVVQEDLQQHQVTVLKPAVAALRSPPGAHYGNIPGGHSNSDGDSCKLPGRLTYSVNMLCL